MAKNGTDIGKAYVQIVPSAQGIKGSITDILKGEATSAGSSAGSNIGANLVSGIKKVLVGGAIFKGLSSIVSEGADLQQSIGGIETLFKDSADKMKQYASEAYKTAGLSSNQYMEQATSFAASLVSSLNGDTAKAADSANQALIDMADNSNKMGTSIESIQNAYQGFAKQNYTMLDNLKLGYGGTKTEMERLLKDAQEISGVKYDISNLSDVYEAIHVIQGELGITGTTALEASSTITGSMAQMKSAFTNLLGNLALGEDIKPSLQALLDSTSTFLFDNLLPMVGDILMQLPTLIGTGLETAIPMIGEQASNLIKNFISFLENQFPTLISKGVDFIDNIGTGIINNLPSLLDSAIKIVDSIAKGIVNNLPKIIDTAVKLITSLVTTIISELPGLFSKISQGFASLNWGAVGKAIINGIVSGVKAIATSLVNTVVSAARSALNAVKSFLGIASPSKKFKEIGKFMALGISTGYESAMPSVLDDINNSTDLLTRGIEANINAYSEPISTNKLNNLEINFAIDNSGKDITEADINKWGNMLTEKINLNLGLMI